MKETRLSNNEINRLTRNAIQEALVYLLSKKEINDISVTEIVSKAGVSRSAYYRNYSSKEEILFDFSNSVFTTLFKDLSKKELVMNPEAWYQHLFSQIKENQRIVKLIFKAGLDSYGEYIPPLDIELYDKKQIYQVNILVPALVSVTKLWTENDFDLSVDEISAICFEIFPHISWIVKPLED